MKYLIVIVAILLIGFIYALLKAAGSADKRIEEMRRKEELNNKDNGTQ